MTLINNTSVEELFEARLIIEAGLAELAAERATESDIADLIEEVEEMKANTGDPEEFLKHDVRFHQAMARAANNKLMSGVMDTVAELLFHIRRQNVAQAKDLEEAIEWHEKIIAAMRKHDPKRAKETLSGHLRAAQSAWAREHRPESNGKVEEGDKAGGKKARGK
jgi:GntR family transcriptional repressor for pyruvate dehydrogenase complex